MSSEKLEPRLLLAPRVDRLVADAQIGGDLGDRTTGGHQIKHLAAKLLGITLRHGHGSFDGCHDQKSSKPTPYNPQGLGKVAFHLVRSSLTGR